MRVSVLSFPKSEPTGLGWAVLAVCFSLPWLIPVHTDPWPTFLSELAAGIVLVPLGIWLLSTRRQGVVFDGLAIGFGLAAAIPAIQAGCGLFAFPAEAPVISFYLIGLAFAVALARHCEACAPGRLAETLFAGLVIAALVSTALALAQWLLLDWGPLAAGIPSSGRPVANVGQPNELSALLVWGLVGIWWGYSHRRIGGLVAVLAASTVLVGIASTQSRTGWLGVAVLLTAALISPTPLGPAKNRAVFFALGAWFVLLVLGWPRATDVASGSGALSLDARMSGGKRPEIWAMMFDGILHRPWFGYGWNQGRLVQLSELPNYADLKIGVQHAHNLVLDLLIWNGVPLGLSLAALLAAWFAWQIRRAVNADQVLLLLALSTFMLHCMLELPHAKAFFLVPAALMMGILNARSGLGLSLPMPRAVIAVGVAVLAATLVLMWVDYRRVESDLLSYRLRMARIGRLPVPPPPGIYILTALQSALVNMRIEPRSGLDAAALERLRVTALRYPIEIALLKYAQAAALNGQRSAALGALSRVCPLVSTERCDAVRSAWDEFLTQHPQTGSVPFPTLPGAEPGPGPQSTR
jgi:O-antigen ligase